MNISKWLFHLTAVATTIFIITIFALVVATLGDPESPADRWFNAYGAMVLSVEVVAIGLFGFLAMIADRNETIRETRQKSVPDAGGTDGE